MGSNNSMVARQMADYHMVLQDHPRVCQLLFLAGHRMVDFNRCEEMYGDEGTAWVFYGKKEPVAIVEVAPHLYKFIPVSEAGRRY